MGYLRRVLAPVAAIWLCCQAGTLALVPVAVVLAGIDAHGAECSCGHGAGAMCPMHHRPSGGARPCSMQATNSSETAVLTVFSGASGLLTEVGTSIPPPTHTAYPRAAGIHVAGERPVPPDPPPPRA